MIKYDEGKWSIGFAFQVYGSVMDRSLALACPCALCAVLLNLSLQYFPNMAQQLADDMDANVHSGFSFVLGFLVVFRTHQAYSRWWEGGTLLQQLRGDWFNAFSNLMAFLNQDPEMEEEVELFKHKMARLFSLLYGSGLRQVATMKQAELQFIDTEGFAPEWMELLDSKETHDTCELVLQWIQRLIVEANTVDIIKIAPPILARVYNQLGQGIVKLNNARKIKQYQVPFNLAQLIAVMLMLHWVATVTACAVQQSNPVMAGLTAFLVCFSFWGVNYIAVELENPYGDDPNDLPICEMQVDLNKSLISLLRPRAVRPPEFSHDPNLQPSDDYELYQKLRDALVVRPMFPRGKRPEDAFANSTPRKSKSRLQELDIEDDPWAKTGLVKKGSMFSESGTGSRQPRDPPLVDDCFGGNCHSGNSTQGQACDSSYRDSEFADGTDGTSRRPSKASKAAGKGGRPSEASATPSAVGKPQVGEAPSPANSMTGLLPRTQSRDSTGQPGGATPGKRRTSTNSAISSGASRTRPWLADSNQSAGGLGQAQAQGGVLPSGGLRSPADLQRRSPTASSLLTAAGSLCSGGPQFFSPSLRAPPEEPARSPSDRLPV